MSGRTYQRLGGQDHERANGRANEQPVHGQLCERLQDCSWGYPLRKKAAFAAQVFASVCGEKPRPRPIVQNTIEFLNTVSFVPHDLPLFVQKLIYIYIYMYEFS